MGYAPGEVAPRDGEVCCTTHERIRLAVKQGDSLPPPFHHKDVGGTHLCQWDYCGPERRAVPR